MKSLKTLRVLAGLTQIELARKSGVDRWRLSMSECGHLSLAETEKKLIRQVLVRAAQEREAKLRGVLENPKPILAEV